MKRGQPPPFLQFPQPSELQGAVQQPLLAGLAQVSLRVAGASSRLRHLPLGRKGSQSSPLLSQGPSQSPQPAWTPVLTAGLLACPIHRFPEPISITEDHSGVSETCVPGQIME